MTAGQGSRLSFNCDNATDDATPTLYNRIETPMTGWGLVAAVQERFLGKKDRDVWRSLRVLFSSGATCQAAPFVQPVIADDTAKLVRASAFNLAP